MPRVHEMLTSKYLKKEEVGRGALFTVRGFKKETIEKDGENETVWVMYFEEADKGLVLKSTNIQLCQKIFNSDNTDDWVGKQIVLFEDPNISFGGKLVGGIRVREPRQRPAAQQQAQAPARAAQPAAQREPGSDFGEEFADDLPWQP